MWDTDVYAISRFRSRWPIATTAPYRIPTTETLSSTPTSTTAAPGCAAVAASGSQVWNGQTGALIANATKKPRNSHFWVVVLSDTCTSWLNRNVPWCPCCAEYT